MPQTLGENNGSLNKEERLRKCRPGRQAFSEQLCLDGAVNSSKPEGLWGSRCRLSCGYIPAQSKPTNISFSREMPWPDVSPAPKFPLVE